MSRLTRRQSLMHAHPIIGIFLWEWEVWRKDQTQSCFRLAPILQDTSGQRYYPIDMWPLLDLPHGPLDDAGVPYVIATDMIPGGYHPTAIAQYGLVNWNAYLATGVEEHKQALMTQARWLVANETPFADGSGGWSHPFPNHEFYATGPWLSAMTQGVGISVLVRAYQLTGEETFLQVARRAVHTFELDIRDGGVSTSIGDGGIFFEEVAVYPAAHILNGYIVALLGLYDYVALTDDAQIAVLIQRSLFTLHILIDDFDLGYGSRYDLLLRRPTSRFYHALHVTLLEVLALYSGCEHCAALAARWATYQRGVKPFINYLVGRLGSYRRACRRIFFRTPSAMKVTYETN